MSILNGLVFWKRSEAAPRFYTSFANIPAWNFHQVKRSGGDLRYLQRGFDEEYPEVDEVAANEHWCSICDEYRKRYPKNDGLHRLVMLWKRTKLQLKYIKTKERHLQTQIATINVQLAQGGEQKRVDYDEIEAFVAAESGAPAMDMRKITALRFYTLADQIKKRYDAQSSSNARSRNKLHGGKPAR